MGRVQVGFRSRRRRAACTSHGYHLRIRKKRQRVTGRAWSWPVNRGGRGLDLDAAVDA